MLLSKRQLLHLLVPLYPLLKDQTHILLALKLQACWSGKLRFCQRRMAEILRQTNGAFCLHQILGASGGLEDISYNLLTLVSFPLLIMQPASTEEQKESNKARLYSPGASFSNQMHNFFIKTLSLPGSSIFDPGDARWQNLSMNIYIYIHTWSSSRAPSK